VIRAPVRTFTLCLVAIFGAEVSARSESETATLDISAIVPATCTVGQLSVDLGSIAPKQKDEVVARSALDISCTSETPYRITIDDGAPTALVSKTGNAQIPYTVAIVNTGPTESARLPSSTMIEILARPTGDEPAGLYRQEILLRLDW
jgi:Spore Coat Protein U domain